MRRIVLGLLVLSLISSVLAQEVPEHYVPPVGVGPGGMLPGVEIIDPPTSRFSKNWVFVIDGSDSMAGIFHRALQGWRSVTQDPTDEWRFCVFAFSDASRTRFFDWRPATPDDFKAAEAWVEHRNQQGVLSKVREALERALRLDSPTLSIVIISDGGFTSASDGRGFGTIRSVIAEGQGWRHLNGLARATITTIGINNPHYSAWCRRCVLDSRTSRPHDYSIPDQPLSNIGQKASNPDCQAFMQEIGVRYHGGYLLVRGLGSSNEMIVGTNRR